MSIEKTIITFPFNHPQREKDEIFDHVEWRLRNIGLKTLLFLSHIGEIKWNTPSQSGYYSKASVIERGVKNTKRVSITSKMGDEETLEEYLVIDRPIEIDGKPLKVEVAYKIEKDETKKGNIVPVSNQESKLVAFFPTEKITYLNFIIQGPYKTTPNRENIPLGDKQNKFIIEETGKLVADSISIMKDLGFLSTKFLELLPINDKHCDEQIYAVIFDEVKERFLSKERLLPTIRGGYSCPNESLLARGKDLPKLLNKNDIKTLFNKSRWLNTVITYERTRELREYLMSELDVEEVNFETFAKNISEEFIRKKPDKWLIRFYRKLRDQRSLWQPGIKYRNAGILRQKPIIRLTNNEHVLPFDSMGRPQAYLSIKTKSKYKTIKTSLTKNADALTFLKELGLTEPDIFAEIREFILPKYGQDEIDIDEDEYLDDIEKLLIAYNKSPSDKREKLISEMRKFPIIESFSPVTGEKRLMKPDDVYLKADDLIEYFKGYGNAYFVGGKLYDKLKEQGLDEFLLDLGCSNTPRRISIEYDKREGWLDQLRYKHGYSWGYVANQWVDDYDLEGLDNFFMTDITKKRSLLLWNLLKSRPRDFFNSVYICVAKYGNQRTHNFSAKFVDRLKETSWLFGKDNDIRKPIKFSPSELSPDYPIDGDTDILVDVLDFQPDEKKALLDEIKVDAEKAGLKVISKEEYELFQQLKAERAEKEQSGSEDNENEWVNPVDPDDLTPRIELVELGVLISPDLREQGIKDGGSGNGGSKKRGNGGPIFSKQIGKQGEKIVFKHLKDRFGGGNDLEETDLGFRITNDAFEEIEVKWLNRKKDVGKGYDFVVVKNGIEMEYIEVKSSTDKEKRLHEITGTQWEFARKLFDAGEGVKYRIYVVVNALSLDAKIKQLIDPIKLWKEGRLYAHPIHFRI